MPKAIQTVDRRTYQTATHALQKLKPVIDALQKVDRQATGNEETFGKIQEFGAFLTGIRDRNQAIVNQGDAQYQNRPIDLINQAAKRFNEITSLIGREQKALQHKFDCREYQVNELQKKNFTVAQIDRIAPPVPQTEIDASNAIVAGHQAEAEGIQRFLNDAPRFDISLLKGTSIDPCHDTITEAAA